MRVCSGLPNTLATRVNDVQCNCASGFTWDTTSSTCVRDCSTDTHSTGAHNPTDSTACLCNTGFEWSTVLPHISKCVRACGSVSNSDGTNPTVDSCNCNSGFVW